MLATQAVMGAVVPILIPFGQVYSGVAVQGTSLTLGEIVAIAATCCSLVSSIAVAIETVRKFQRSWVLLEDAGKPIFREVNLFFAFGGEYQRFETGGSHKLAWSTFKTRLSQYEFELAKRPNDAYGRQHVNNAKNDTQSGSSTSTSQSSPGADIDTA
jgi:hypothetical protein